MNGIEFLIWPARLEFKAEPVARIYQNKLTDIRKTYGSSVLKQFDLLNDHACRFFFGLDAAFDGNHNFSQVTVTVLARMDSDIGPT